MRCACCALRCSPVPACHCSRQSSAFFRARGDTRCWVELRRLSPSSQRTSCRAPPVATPFTPYRNPVQQRRRLVYNSVAAQATPSSMARNVAQRLCYITAWSVGEENMVERYAEGVAIENERSRVNHGVDDENAGAKNGEAAICRTGIARVDMLDTMRKGNGSCRPFVVQVESG